MTVVAKYFSLLDRLRALRAENASTAEQDAVREELELLDELLSDDERVAVDAQWARGWPP